MEKKAIVKKLRGYQKSKKKKVFLKKKLCWIHLSSANNKFGLVSAPLSFLKVSQVVFNCHKKTTIFKFVKCC